MSAPPDSHSTVAGPRRRVNGVASTLVASCRWCRSCRFGRQTQKIGGARLIYRPLAETGHGAAGQGPLLGVVVIADEHHDRPGRSLCETFDQFHAALGIEAVIQHAI